MTERNESMPMLKLLKRNSSTMTSSSARRMLIGFDTSKNSNSNFLHRLDRMISVKSKPKSRVSPHVADVKYTPGEGIKLLAKAVNRLND